MSCTAVRRLTTLTLAAALLVGAAAPAFAQDDQPAKLGISPLGQSGSWFDLELEPGEQTELAVGLANHGDAPVEAHTYAADVYSLINGGMGVRLHDEPVENPATDWLDYTRGDHTLQPGRELRRSFTVTVPDDAEPGQHIAALVLQHQGASATGDSNVGMEQVLRQAIAVSITIPGPVAPDLAIDESTYHPTTTRSAIRTEIRNPGNQHLAPTSTTRVTGPDGDVVADRDQDLAIIYAGSTTQVELGFDNHLDAGTYTVETTLTDDTHDVEATHTSTVEVTAPPADTQPPASSALPDPITRALDQTGNPTLVIVLLGVIALLLITLLVVVLARRRHPRRPDDTHTPAPATDPSPPSAPSTSSPAHRPEPVAPASVPAQPTPVSSPGEPLEREPVLAGTRLFTAHAAPGRGARRSR